jgi:hypothetical protein
MTNAQNCDSNINIPASRFNYEDRRLSSSGRQEDARAPSGHNTALGCIYRAPFRLGHNILYLLPIATSEPAPNQKSASNFTGLVLVGKMT